MTNLKIALEQILVDEDLGTMYGHGGGQMFKNEYLENLQIQINQKYKFAEVELLIKENQLRHTERDTFNFLFTNQIRKNQFYELAKKHMVGEDPEKIYKAMLEYFETLRDS